MALDPQVVAAIAGQAEALGRSFDDPEVIARKLAEWAGQFFPEKVSSAFWITAKGDRDKGVAIELREIPIGDRLKLRVSGLLGAWSAGLAGTVDLRKKMFGATVGIGAGAVVRYIDLKAIDYVAVATLRF